MAAWQPDICNETSGFLFKHECFQTPRAQCQTCGKPICEEHAHELATGTFCTTCARGQIQAQQAAEKRPDADPNAAANPRGYGYHGYNNPYLYGSSYYYGYHWDSPSYSHHSSHSGLRDHDPQDFTGGDGGSFATEGDESFEGEGGRFEQEMGES